ncbi:hypothetical protein M885DRAFT_592686 [Pelagophyceae sp. CCMP2097]|nr:hypothetical protein M885DRAFT_592686 [Pelagophyceae sp. CCMP2097]
MDNELPTFKRIDINCEDSVEFLQWHVDDARADDGGARLATILGRAASAAAPAEDFYVAPRPRPVSPPLPADDADALLSTAQRGLAESGRVDRRASKSAKAAEPESPRRGPLLLCVNDDDVDAELFATSSGAVRQIRHAAIQPEDALGVHLSSGRLFRRRDDRERADLTVCLTNWGRLLHPQPEEEQDLPRQDSKRGDKDSSRAPAWRGPKYEEVVVRIDFSPAEPLGVELEHDVARKRVKVHKVHPGLQAARDPRLKKGMVLTKCDGHSIFNLDDFEQRLRPLKQASRNIEMEFVEFVEQRNDVAERKDDGDLDDGAPSTDEASSVPWSFATGAGVVDDSLVARRRKPKRLSAPAFPKALDDVLGNGHGEIPKDISLQIRNVSEESAVEVTRLTTGPSYKIVLLPGDHSLLKAKTCDRLLLLVRPKPAPQTAKKSGGGFFNLAAAKVAAEIDEASKAAPPPDAPVLALRLGADAVSDLGGYSLIWQSQKRTLSCVPQSKISAGASIRDEGTSMQCRARIHVVRDVRQLLGQSGESKGRAKLASDLPDLNINVM